ncbi:hypothetical protein A4A49_18169 [Nicotiana attenuata]|uniref:Uncharacterized protein n=1 Tax=Nicotiana attenuata TaxID=49451 RepID=A0A1J6JFX6_NICAT|nr:hypothetical protein A4A49_18169 [Nicotiana attenuata]
MLISSVVPHFRHCFLPKPGLDSKLVISSSNVFSVRRTSLPPEPMESLLPLSIIRKFTRSLHLIRGVTSLQLYLQRDSKYPFESNSLDEIVIACLWPQRTEI